MKKFSFNNRFIVEPYLSDRAIKVTQSGGFAMIQQKVALKGLKLLADTILFDKPAYCTSTISNSPVIPAGSTIYIREEYLHNQEWAKRLMECDAIEGKFLIVEPQYVEMIVINEDSENR